MVVPSSLNRKTDMLNRCESCRVTQSMADALDIDLDLDLDLDGDDEARPNSCEKNPWAGRAESAESEELRLDVDGGSIARCLGSTAFMYGATARKWDSPAGVATGSAGRVSWTFW
jgi:hypothetical protein